MGTMEGTRSSVTTHLAGKQAGHTVTIIEANANRLGGRIKTFGGPRPAFTDVHQYAEAGAMHIPDEHQLTVGLIDRLGLTRQRFHLTDIDPATQTAANHAWIGVNGVRVRRSQPVDLPPTLLDQLCDPRGLLLQPNHLGPTRRLPLAQQPQYLITIHHPPPPKAGQLTHTNQPPDTATGTHRHP